MTLREAAQQALEALACPGKAKTADDQAAITALRAALESDDTEMLLRQHRFEIGRLRAALAEPAEPVAFIGTDGELGWLKKPNAIRSAATPLYTAPTPRSAGKGGGKQMNRRYMRLPK